MMKTDYNEDKTMYTTNDKNEQAWAWVCPMCGELNLWGWEPEEIPRVNDVLDMICEHCGKTMRMICEMRQLRKPISPPMQERR